MKKYTAEDIVMNLVCNGGDCRSKALEAIQSEKAELSLLMVHGQDHLMDGMVVYDLASEIIEILRERKL